MKNEIKLGTKTNIKKGKGRKEVNKPRHKVSKSAEKSFTLCHGVKIVEKT